MSFWTSERLKSQLSHLVTPANERQVTNCRIELTVGGQYFHTGEKTRRPLNPEEQVCIPPGEFALLTTAETIHIPASALGLISLRTNAKFQGLVNVSGFHVDPGYSGPLVFGLLNAGHKPYVIEQGQSLFLLWIADLDSATKDVFNESPRGITTEMVQNLHGSVPSLFDLSQRIRDVEFGLSRRLEDLSARLGAVDTKLEAHRSYSNAALYALIGLIVAAFLVPVLQLRLAPRTQSLPTEVSPASNVAPSQAAPEAAASSSVSGAVPATGHGTSATSSTDNAAAQGSPASPP